MRSILSATRAMLPAFKLAPKDCESVIPTIALALNEAILERLGCRSDVIPRSPLEVSTEIEPKLQVLRGLPAGTGKVNAKTMACSRGAD